MQNNAFVETAGDQLRLTGAGKLAASDAFAGERATAAVDDARASELLEEFHALDARMKDIVTGWQVRDVAGEQVLNDHSDAEYDASLLDALAALDTGHGRLARSARAAAPAVPRVPRAARAKRSNSARGGDQRFVASPRVDSYHSVWFELHEHLIRLAGKRRTGTE